MKYKHGTVKTKVYQAWINMRRRCRDTKLKHWAGRGISVCSEWESFETFLTDMGEPLSEKHSLDRIDNDGNYNKENCRWATITVQINNRNRFARKNKTGYAGVYLNRTGKAYVASVKKINCGSYKTPEEAALAYNKKALEVYGDKAILNRIWMK